MEILEKINGIGWVILGFSVVYIGGHIIVAWLR